MTNPNLTGLKKYKFLKKLNKDISTNDKKLIAEIIYGCNDNYRVLRVIVDGYYFKDGKNCSINEKKLYYSNFF